LDSYRIDQIQIPKGASKTKATSFVMTPGAAVKKQLDLYNLSVSQFTEGIKISPSAARGIVAGKIRIGVQTARRLSEYFGKTPEYWIPLQNARESAELSSDSKNTAVLKIITAAVKVPPKASARKVTTAKKGTKKGRIPGKATVKKTVKKAGPGRPRTKKSRFSVNEYTRRGKPSPPLQTYGFPLPPSTGDSPRNAPKEIRRKLFRNF
jgi:addiction module HigA family antidote